jgi:hypothetical protein
MMPKRKSMALQEQATVLLRESPGAWSDRRTGLIGALSDRETNRNIELRGQRKIRQLLLQAYRNLPKSARRELTCQFKRERAVDPNLDWHEWLVAQFDLR